MASKAIAQIRKAAANKTAQAVTVTALSGGAGAIAGKYLQDYLNKSPAVVKDGKNVPPMSRSISGIPTGTFIGAALAAIGLAASKGTTRQVLGGAGAGLAGGSYITGDGMPKP